MDNNGNEPAYPILGTQAMGLTKREIFAAMAMATLCASDHNCTVFQIAEDGLQYANALLVELAKEQNSDETAS